MQIADLVLTGKAGTPWMEISFEVAFDSEDYPADQQKLLKLAGESLIRLSKQYAKTDISAV